MSGNNKIRTEKDIFGNLYHYNEYGRKVGMSRQTPFGKTEHYDEYGRKKGSSFTNAFGKSVHYDNTGQQMGTSQSGILGTDHYDKMGRKAGRTDNIGVATMESDFTQVQSSGVSATKAGSVNKNYNEQPGAGSQSKMSLLKILILIALWFTASMALINIGCLFFIGNFDVIGTAICGVLSILLFRHVRSWGKRK